MRLRVLQDTKGVRRGTPSIAISNKLMRATLNRHAVMLMSDKYGSEVTHVQILLDDDAPGIFYLQPCLEIADGAKKLDKPSPGTRSLQVSLLLKELNWQEQATTRFPVVWEEEVQAAKVDTNIQR